MEKALLKKMIRLWGFLCDLPNVRDSEQRRSLLWRSISMSMILGCFYLLIAGVLSGQCSAGKDMGECAIHLQAAMQIFGSSSSQPALHRDGKRH